MPSKEEDKSPFVKKELDFIKVAFSRSTFLGKDILPAYSLFCVIENEFKDFQTVDIHVLKQVIDKCTILCSDAVFVVGIIQKMEKLISKPKGK